MQVLCYDYALNYLSRYPKTSQDLWLQLKKKWYNQADIDHTIARLQDIGFLDDRLYADMYLRSEVQRKWKPLFLIKKKLQQKWIGRELLDELCEEYEEELIGWQRLKIKKEILRRSGRWLEEQKIIKKLQWRGYMYRDIQEVMEKILEE